mmetsp:Transcript_48224/g.112856  ORF Transcript_48224/g.112856 Transcript_48224/m.112856 type:complete len:224 (+) Transcript_48224:1145-1816(+)
MHCQAGVEWHPSGTAAHHSPSRKHQDCCAPPQATVGLLCYTAPQHASSSTCDGHHNCGIAPQASKRQSHQKLALALPPESSAALWYPSQAGRLDRCHCMPVWFHAELALCHMKAFGPSFVCLSCCGTSSVWTSREVPLGSNCLHLAPQRYPALQPLVEAATVFEVLQQMLAWMKQMGTSRLPRQLLQNMSGSHRSPADRVEPAHLSLSAAMRKFASVCSELAN